MKKTVLVVFIITTILLAILGFHLIGLSEANFSPMPVHSTINVFSPQNGTYYTNSFVLNFSVVEDQIGNSVRYSLDGGNFGTVTHFRIVSEEPITEDSFGKQYNLTSYTIMCDQEFNDLPDGNHSLTVENGYVDPLYGHFYENSEVTICLNIDTSTPKIENLSLRNATFSINDIPINFTVSKTVSWIGFTLDNHANITISGCNITLTGLSEGSHKLVIYANDTVGRMGSQTVYFSVAKPEPFPTTLVAASLASVTIVGAGVLVYFRKRSHARSNNVVEWSSLLHDFLSNFSNSQKHNSGTERTNQTNQAQFIMSTKPEN
jgi:hypothetical protein